LKNIWKRKIENDFYLNGPPPHFRPADTSRPDPACARARARRGPVDWAHAAPRAPFPALANQRARVAAWPCRTGGRGRWLAAWSEPPHLDGNASRDAPDRAITSAPAPILLARSSFQNMTSAPLPPLPPSPEPACRPFHHTASSSILPRAFPPSGAARAHLSRLW
jgi:hypothetical protein